MSAAIVQLASTLHTGIPSPSPSPIPSHFPGVSFWGPVSEWFGGTATLLAVGIALWTSLASERRLIESKYAAVSAWFELPLDAEFGNLCIKNGTDYPIYKWEVTASWKEPQTKQEVKITMGSSEFGLLPPEKEFHRFAVEKYRAPKTDAEVVVEISFQDGMQRQRRRLNSGRLN